MNNEDLLSPKELQLKKENKPNVDKMLNIILGHNVDDALTILEATRRAIVRATNPKIIDESIIKEAKEFLEKI